MKFDAFVRSFSADGLWVKASHPLDFNDFFECTGGVWGMPCDNFVSEFYELRPDQLVPATMHGSKGEYLRDWLWRAFQDRSFIGQGYRISCFSNAKELLSFTGSDMRMWSHYCDCGRGFRVGIETDELEVVFKPVVYSNVPPRLDLGSIVSMSDLDVFVEKCITTKHEIWRPESEARVIFRGPSPKVVWSGKMWRWHLPMNCIREISIGNRVMRNNLDREESMSLLRHASVSMNDVRIDSAVMDYNTYSYQYPQIRV